jgi:3-oxoacyl-[acyl-carrier protein] reductase
MSNKLAGKIAIVTGASKGIGAGIAKDLGAAGASVVVNYASSKEGADRVVDEIVKAGGTAVAVQGDVSKQEDIDRLFAETKRAYGRLDILVNNAGVFEFSPLEAVTDNHFHRQFDINVLGLIRATQKAAAAFDGAGGSIINISSVAATVPMAGGSVYSATKAAVDAVTKSLAQELGPRGIRVNSLNPGMVETEGFHTAGIAGSEMEKSIAATTPLGRIGQPNDIGPVAVFLASPDSGWVTGQTLLVSGGKV